MKHLARRLALVVATFVVAMGAHAAEPSAATLQCLGCHDGSKKLEAVGPDGKKRTLHAVPPGAAASGVHAKLQCSDCHKDVIDQQSPHKKTGADKPDCVGCHQKTVDEARAKGTQPENPGVNLVLEQAAKYKLSIHSKPNADEPTQPNASCSSCHDPHTFAKTEPGTPAHAAKRLAGPEKCGTCHEDHLDEFSGSVHGKAVIDERDAKAAICSDCHNPHGVDKTNAPLAKLGAVHACATCHKDNAKTYADTYHGEVAALGYAHTAMCFNCHGSHDIRAPEDKKSKVHPDNRLKTCRECHKQANLNFVSFEPHGNAHDFKRYPQIWIATKFMIGLLAGTFAFFWIHLLLWLYRESSDRRQGVTRAHVRVDQLGIPPGKQVRRFGPWWRLGHLLFAVSLMILTLTGMTLMYADSAWAPAIVKALGGPKVTGIIHRVNAVIFTGVFVVHLVYIAIHIGRRWKTFRWFGPDSLIPNWQDLKDVIAMFKWFLGKGPRPVFDRWTYWEKFDYWAPFWGVAIVAVSGFLMWFPQVTSQFLPGWVFNVAAIAHGEEAFLAAVFLFTVHFFNNHFRPEKFPLDTVMFTGTVPLAHFARDHTLQYQRLVESGELEKYLVDAPSKPMALGSRILGFALIAFGLFLLVLIVMGFIKDIVS